MLIYVVRHGIAVDVGEKGVRTDAGRMLSADGRKKTRSAAEGLRALKCEPERIVSSPLVRARETAEILADVLADGLTVERADELAPAFGPERTTSWLKEQPRVCTVLVGHMPDLGMLASYWISGHSGVDILFKKGAVCRIFFEGSVEAGAGTLEWLLQPAVLRSLGGG